ncbi:protoporphyrinogen oxidase [Streptomyces subrutilus]|uniref:Coproporphyrinogen III oxidase n=1 Tax=Streptomyces subrutilus TaxID=36818 RepID=A0A5P2UG75_9ACTN|nr:protoporphyrinogen oxidase [Streptomyces subrutilus]QEU78263.1 protoporphyrinogen oxidase [Streptomyces subrutilus]WSJ32575.1 protoporphyrinogen oxidase [Streptomyces subrutilus]GGZ61121.1 protoporphyrinogen oxidase [Streptomyces subrutilus]
MHEADTRTDRPGGPGAPAAPHGHVVVIGGGIAGLAAAHRLLADGVRVTLLEAGPRLGGKLRSGELAGAPVDLGAESVLARRPEAVGLARAVGLGDALQPPATATAHLWTRGALRPMPRGHVMGVPGDPAPLAASGVLSPEGLARIGAERDLPPAEIGEDVAVGAFVAARLGHEVVDRLVEPLLGGVYAGDAYRISLRAAVPQLFAAARTHALLGDAVRDVQRRAARQPQAAGPVFAGIDGGIGRLPAAVADACRAAGARILLDTPARELVRTAAGGWRVVAGGEAIDADGVILATPAGPAARLLAALAPAAAAELDGVSYASMALVTMAFRTADLPASVTGGGASGFLVPPVDGRTIKASTFSSNKWAWAGADPDLFLLRTSVGRHGDEKDLGRDDADLVDVSLADLGEAVGLAARPVARAVTRWDAGLPQYPVGHLDRVARIRASVAALPGLAVCGALYDGVGIPACIASAGLAADAVTAAIGTPGSDH